MQGRSFFRFSISSVLLLITTIAVAVVVGVRDSKSAGFPGNYKLVTGQAFNLADALLTAASVPIVVGLVQQAWWLGQYFWQGLPWPRRQRDGLAIAICLRLLVGMLLAISVGVKLWSRGENVDHNIWCIAIIAGMALSLRRRRATGRRAAFVAFVNVMGWICGATLAACMLPHVAIIQSYVHISTSGFEAAQPLKFQREGVFPHHVETWDLFFWCAVAAASCVVVNLFTLVWAMRTQATSQLLRSMPWILLALGLGASGAYSAWYFCIGLPRFSPDLSAGGFEASFRPWLIGTVGIAAILIAGAWRLSISSTSVDLPEELDIKCRRAWHLAPLWTLFTAFATCFFLVNLNARHFEFTDWFKPSNWLPIADFLLTYVEFYLPLAMAILSVRVLWLRFRRPEMLAVRVVEASGRRFIVALAALVLITITGGLAISAYCFAFWLGPFYRWNYFPLPI